MHRQILIGILLVHLFLMTACSSQQEVVVETTLTEGQIRIVDDSDQEIILDKPAERIISLYSAHTENLYEIGAGDLLIGRGTSDIYPVEVLEKTVYDYNSDPEKVIAAEPDLVLIRPFIERKNPEFVETLKKVGIPVVSLYPESFEAFDGYIQRLGQLTGKEAEAQKRLDTFYEDIAHIKEQTDGLSKDVGVYFESTQTEYRTVTVSSMPGRAIELAGGYSVAGDLQPIQEGSSIAAFGVERILEKSDDIDVYVSQRGAMNAGGNYHTIVIRPGFDAIKAVQEKKVYEINQKIISSPTFRFTKGILEMARMLHPDHFDDVSYLNTSEPLTRKDYAELMVKYNHRLIFVPTSKYYDKTYKNHTYAFFQDVSVQHPHFDMIETAVLAGYMDGYKENDKEWFHPDAIVTRDNLANTAVLLSEFRPGDEPLEIIDLDQSEHGKVVQMLVDNQIFDLEDGRFNPDREVTGAEVMEMLKRIERYNEERGLNDV